MTNKNLKKNETRKKRKHMFNYEFIILHVKDRK